MLPPHDLAAEEAVLGCLLLDGESMSDVVGANLQPEDFYDSALSELYAACVTLYNAGKPIDQVSVGHRVKGQQALILDLQAKAPASMEVEHYAQVVKHASECRQVIAAAGQIAALGYEAGETTDILTRGVDLLLRISDNTDRRGDPADLASEALNLTRSKEITKVLHLPWGRVEALTGPLGEGQVWIVGARTSVGKTTLLLSVALSLVEAGKTVLYATAEELKRDVVLRIAAMRTGIDLPRVARGQVSEDDQGKLVEVAGWLGESSLHTLYTHKVADIERRALRLSHEKGLSLILVDYIQRFLPQGKNRYEETTQVSNKLKSLAGDLEVPIMVASQFSRGEGEPELFDLRDSGALEEDCDVALLLHRHPDKHLYVSTGGENSNREMKLKVAKNRLLGQIGTVQLSWNPTYRYYGEA